MFRAFRIVEPRTVVEASHELRHHGELARVYAGGAELLLLMRSGVVRADHLINIKRIETLNALTWDGHSLSLGATVTHRRLETDPLVRRYAPMFAYAESQVGNVRVRNQGTLGGNLCFADPHADPATALLVYGAAVTVASDAGERQMPLDRFLKWTYETALEPGEVLTEVHVPPEMPGWRYSYVRVERLYRPTVNVAAAVKLQDGRVGGVRLAVGCVGPKALRLEELESRLRDVRWTDVGRLIAGERLYLREKLEPVDDILGSAEYKIHLTIVLLNRAMSQGRN